jgi:hypothetical protein
MMVDKEQTKISISKGLHELIRRICDEKGMKMYYFENEAIKKYIKDNYQEYSQYIDKI